MNIFRESHMKPRVLYLAPMCFNPPRDGGSLWILQVARALGAAGHPCTVIGHDFILEIDPDKGERTRDFRVDWLSKPKAAILALLRSGHYNEIKHTNPRWIELVRDYIGRNEPDAVIISNIWMMGLLRFIESPDMVICDTQNTEWKLYDNYIAGTRNPLIRRLSRTSRRRLDEIMQELPTDTVLMHIAESDVEDHRVRRPDLRHLCVPSGCEVTLRTDPPAYGVNRKNLIFCGNLSNKVNQDALTYFAKTIWPVISDVSTFIAAGSNPSPSMTQLCQQNGWELISNFPDEDKMALYNRSHFAVLPLPYGAGSKMKLLEACGFGLPVLTTPAGATGGHDLPSFVTISDNPEEWRDTIIRTNAIDPEWEPAAIEFAKIYSHEGTIAPLLALLATPLIPV